MRPERHLTLDVDAADFAVDLSNVVRDRALCGGREADLTRFFELIRALIRFTKDQSVQVYAVADESLLRQPALMTEELTTLRRWYRQGRIQTRPVADDRLLELADVAGLRVISDDKYLDAYRTYPWIPGNRDRFLKAVPGPGGVGVVVIPRTMPTPPDWQISRKEEESELLAVGMYDRRHGTGARRHVLTRLWRCPEADCPIFGEDAPATQPPPVFRNQKVLCPTHLRPLTDIGPRSSQKQLKLRVDGVVKARFMLMADRATVVGRAPAEPGFALHPDWLSQTAHDRISREHAELTWDGNDIAVRDVSRNGTWVRRDSASDNPGKRVPKHHAWRLRPGEVIVLCDGVELLASGRTFVFDAGPTVPVRPGALQAEAAQATMIYRPPKPR